jgi:uncharacterized protein
MNLKSWQWGVLILPIAIISIGFLVVAGIKIHEWGLNWIWAIVSMVFLGWRWLLVRWTRSPLTEVESVLAEIDRDAAQATPSDGRDRSPQIDLILQDILNRAADDRPIWEDWVSFWSRCQELITAIAKIYHPEVKYPLLNIYVTQAYGLIRGTTDDLDAWMQKLAPALDRITIAQAYQAYEAYQTLEPSARKVMKVWNWAQWLLNPVTALTRQTTQRSTLAANQQLIGNLSQMLRETALRNLARQAVALYGGTNLPFTPTPAPPDTQKTQSIKELLSAATPPEQVIAKPVSILLLGRTGAGKSSTINTLFDRTLAQVDILPSTDRLQQYQWQQAGSEILNLWDSPGYEQVAPASNAGGKLLNQVESADLILLVTPALDPALQMDRDWLESVRQKNQQIPIVTIVTQVDRLRPLREWNPPYDWQMGDRPKEIAIRAAVAYRQELLGVYSNLVLPLVNGDATIDRSAWGEDRLSLALLAQIEPAKQLRLARFLTNLDARSAAAAQIVDRYVAQITTTQGLTQLLKSPILQFLSTLTTGSPALAQLLAAQIPVEQLPVVLSKLQMAYELRSLLAPRDRPIDFDPIEIGSLIIDTQGTPEVNTWEFGLNLIERWSAK